MTASLGTFDPYLVPAKWFGYEAIPEGWFDPQFDADGGGGDVTVALTGFAAAYATGTLAPAIDVALTGQAGAYGQGTLSPATEIALTGQSGTFATGTLSPETAVALTGEVGPYAQGTIGVGGDVTVALTGIAASYSLGTLTASTDGTADTHDPETWKEYRKSLRNLAKLAAERRRARDQEAEDIRQEILEALGEAKPLESGAEVRAAVAAVAHVLPSKAPEMVTEAQLSRVTNWAPIYAAMERLESAIAYERMIEDDDEEVLLLI